MHTGTYVYIRASVIVCAAAAVIGASLAWDVTAQVQDELQRPDAAADTMTSPAAPTGLHAIAGDTRVVLFWDNPANSAIRFYQYRQKEGSNAYGRRKAIIGSSATTTYYTITGLTNGTVYKYKIQVFDGVRYSADSAEVSVIPAADNTAPTLGTVTASSTDGTVVSSVRYLNTGDTVTVSVPVTDPNPPSTAPTVTMKFGASGTERTMTAGTRTLSFAAGDPGVAPSSSTATYPYTYTLQNGDAGTLRYKITGVTDTAGTPNSMTDQTTFTEVSAIKAETPVTNIGIQTASDSGADDNITNDTTAPVIEFTQTSGATVTAKYRKTGAAQWTTIPSNKISATGTAGTITLPNLTAGDGDYEMEITQQATGKRARTAHYIFALDTVIPTVSVDTGPFRPQQPPIKISDGGDVSVSLNADDDFGDSAALSADGTLLAVGADGTSSNKGAVYLFEKSNDTWTQSLKISDNNGGTGELDIPLSTNDVFGESVALSADGTLLAVGARGDSSYTGAAYLFEKRSGAWSKILKISDNDGGTGELDISLDGTDFFGAATALSADGTVLAVGAIGDDDGTNRDTFENYNQGAVYLFEKRSGVWSQTLKISENGGGTGKVSVTLERLDNFGTSTALSADGTLLAVGVQGDLSYKGAVYLFEKRNGSWSQSLKISDNDGGDGELDVSLAVGEYFGSAVSLSSAGTVLAVGAESPNDFRGSVRLFEKRNNVWSRTLTISDSEVGTGEIGLALSEFDGFSRPALSADATLLAVGANGDSSYKGSVYLFDDTGAARSVFVTATDNEQNGSIYEYVTVTGSTCGAAQFTTTQTAYTKGNNIEFTAGADAGKRVCFKTTDAAGNAAVYTLSEPIKTIDRTAPTLSATRNGAGSSADYRVYATDTSALTGRTKDNVASAACTADTDTSGSAGWTDYTPGELTGTAHDTNGRCVIITDAAGNSAKQHLSDGT